MKPLLVFSSSVNVTVPHSPPSFSRMPPDGHEFPPNYREIANIAAAAAGAGVAASLVNGGHYKSNNVSDLYADLGSPPPPSSPSYRETFYKRKNASVAAYTDVLNEAKLLDVERNKYVDNNQTANASAAPVKKQSNGVGGGAGVQSWRNDERSECSVKDKIAMFSNAITQQGDVGSAVSRPSQRFSKSTLAVNTAGCRGKERAGEFTNAAATLAAPPSVINRTQSSIDLTLFASSCGSSAYASSCSPDSSLSPMSSPSYTIGSSSTLPRKVTAAGAGAIAMTAKSTAASINGGKHSSLARATSFAGAPTTLLHSRSQSLVNMLHSSTATTSPPSSSHRDSLTMLIEQRRRTMSKLRGLVIPERTTTTGETSLKPIVDLPEIKCKEVTAQQQATVVPQFQPIVYQPYAPKTSNGTSAGGWKSALNGGAAAAAEMPKYSPAFKRKTLAVYGVSSSASSLSSSLNSSREELRDSGTQAPPPPPKKSASSAPVKPPRVCNTQLVYGPSVYRSIFEKQRQQSTMPVTRITTSSSSSSLKLHEDSDNDSAVSSSRSSLCQEYSPPLSPSPAANGGAETGGKMAENGESGGGGGELQTSKRVLKPESVEAINRKNVLSSAKYSCGKDFKVGSPLIKDVYDGRRFSEGFADEWLSYDKIVDDEGRMKDYLEGADSDSSVKESSSVDTDEALDKSIDSTDSLCGNYKNEYQSGASNKKEASSDSDYADAISEGDAPYAKSSKKSIVRELLKSGETTNAVKTQESTPAKSRPTATLDTKKSVSDIKKTFERSTNGGRRGGIVTQNHLRMSSTDSTTSEDSLPMATVHGVNATNLLREQQFGSITSLASSTSLISQQELQQLIDDANQTLEETSASGEHDLMVIILHRDTVTSSIGITLAGGADYEAKEITVHKVLIGSPADKDGRIQKGDRILSINGRNMKGVTHREALSILKAPRPEVVLVVSRWKTEGSSVGGGGVALSNLSDDPLTVTFKPIVRPPRIPEITQDCDNGDNKMTTNKGNSDKLTKGPITSVTLVKEGGGLGFSLEGGKDSPFGDLPLTIKKIFTGGCAAKSALLEAGDELVSLNGIDVSVMSRTEAWNMMKRLSDGQIVLKIRKRSKE